MKIAPAEIQSELDRVLNSRCFRSRKTAQRFIKYVVTQTLNGRGNDINQLTIAMEALGKDADFDPSSNPLIRVQAGRLRKQLDDYYSTEGNENQFHITLPTGSYQPVFIHRDEHTNLKITSARYSPSVSRGPGLICVPRLFVSDSENGWNFISQLTRDFVIQLTQFSFCQVLFADENASKNRIWPDAAWDDYDTDFALLFDLYENEQGSSLKCSLAHGQTKQIIWAEDFPLGSEYPSPHTLKSIHRRIAHDTVSLERGVAHRYWANHLIDSGNKVAPQYEVMMALHKRMSELSFETLSELHDTCEKRLKKYPNDIQAIIVSADIYRTEYLTSFGVVDSVQENLSKLSTKLLQLTPGNAYAHYFQALSNFLEGQTELSLESLQQALTINPLDSHLQVLAGLLLIGHGDWKAGMEHIDATISISHLYPDWYHIPQALFHFKNADYEQMYKSASKIHTQSLWSNVINAVSYKLNNKPQLAADIIAQLGDEIPVYDEKLSQLRDALPNAEGNVINQLISEFSEIPRQ